jgi:hypothetical protein
VIVEMTLAPQANDAIANDAIANDKTTTDR